MASKWGHFRFQSGWLVAECRHSAGPWIWVWETLHLLVRNAQVGLDFLVKKKINEKNVNGRRHLSPSTSEAEKGGRASLVYPGKN